MSQSPAETYASVEKSTASGRQLEASALFRVARGLQAAKEQWGRPGSETSLHDALRLNQRLWTFFQAELSGEDCQLPMDLRLSLLRLVEFIDRRTFDIMTSPAPEKLDILISINRNVAAGLATEQGGGGRG